MNQSFLPFTAVPIISSSCHCNTFYTLLQYPIQFESACPGIAAQNPGLQKVCNFCMKAGQRIKYVTTIIFSLFLISRNERWSFHFLFLTNKNQFASTITNNNIIANYGKTNKTKQ